MANRKFSRDYLLDILGTEDVIHDEITDQGRWSIYHWMVFKAEDGKFYGTCYSVGATEQQDESPWEYDGDEIECEEVHQVPKTVMVWETV